MVVISYLAGSIPFSNLFSRRLRGVDLRRVGTGTVSGTALYRVAGFGPMAVAGVADIAKGAVGPALAGRERPVLGAAAASAAVAGHNWSTWIAGAGGRGISPAIGAMLVGNWPGAVVLLGGLVGGRLARQTGVGSVIAFASLPLVLNRTGGRRGRWMAAAVVAPLLAKRLMGNSRPQPPMLRTMVNRLLFDRDSWEAAPE